MLNRAKLVLNLVYPMYVCYSDFSAVDRLTSDVTDATTQRNSSETITKSVASVKVTKQANSREEPQVQPFPDTTPVKIGNKASTNGESSPAKFSTMQFSEIRSLKRVNRVEEGIGTDNADIIETPGIVDPQTGEVLTVGDAIRLRVLDMRTGRINMVVNSKTVSVTIEEAVEHGLVNPTLADRLLGPCGIVEDESKPQLSLLEAIQRELLDAERGPTERAKVRSLDERGVSIADAVRANEINTKSGQYLLGDGREISLKEAFRLGLLKKEIQPNKRKGVALADAIVQGIVDERTGQIVDRFTGDKYPLEVAIEKGLIDPEYREVVEVIGDTKVTVEEALRSGILKDGSFMHSLSQEKLPLREARRRQLVIKPMTLKDCVDLDVLKDGFVKTPTHRGKVSILEGISRGVLDSDTAKSVTDTRTDELLTLSDALSEGIILPEGKFVDLTSNKVLTIPEAVDKGYITSVSVKSIFDIDGFKDQHSGEFLSLNLALEEGIVKNGDYVIDLKSGKTIPLEEAVKLGLVRPEVLEMLQRKIGIKSGGKELSVIGAVVKNYLDPKMGVVLEKKTKRGLPLDQAVKKKIITPEGAALLNSLLNITLTTQTVTKTIKRYSTSVTVAESSKLITFGEAIRKGLIDEDTQMFKDESTGRFMPVEDAVKEGLLGFQADLESPSSSSSSRDDSPPKSPSKKKSPIKDSVKRALDSLSRQGSTSPTKKPTDSSPEKSAKMSEEFIAAEKVSTERQVFELPPDGWYLGEAIDQRLFDSVTGLFIIPGTDRLVSFEECIHLEIINSKSAVVVDPSRARNLSLPKSIEKKVLDSTGHYITQDGKKITMKEAIAKKRVILEARVDVDSTSPRLIQVTKVSGKPDIVEVSEIGADRTSFKEIKPNENESNLEPLQVSPGVIFDPATALVIFTENGNSDNLLEAVKSNKIEPRKVKVKDPFTGNEININEAIRKGIIDKKTGDYTDKSGRKISFADAAKFGVIAVIGAPLVAASKAAKMIQRAMVVDPKTGEEIPIEVAYERGLVDKETLMKYEEAMDVVDENQVESPVILKTNSFVETPSTKDSKTGAVADNAADQQPNYKVLDTSFISLEDDTRPSEGELTRARVTTEPKYKVSIGRARTLSQSPDREAKPVVLQKMRKKVVKPKDAVEVGIIDKETADLLEKPESYQTKSGEKLNLSEAISLKTLDGNTGAIRDPQSGEILTIKEAMDKGILDSAGSSGRLLIPIARSLSVPAALDQGLYENGKIIHPETGAHLSLKEAILCEIVNPTSKLIDPNTGKKLTLEQAIAKGSVDEDKSKVITRRGSLDLLSAVEGGIFDKIDDRKGLQQLPPAGMTFPVALKRGLIDSESQEVIHPVTGKRKSVQVAIQEDFIMALPCPVSPDSMQVTDALNSKLIDSDKGIFIHPKTGEEIPISDAVEMGLLVLKPQEDMEGNITSITETIKSYQTITTKTISLKPDYILIGPDEVKNSHTGEVMSLNEAKNKGVVRDESETQEEFQVSGSKANDLSENLIDIKQETFKDPASGRVMLLREAVQTGLLNPNDAQKYLVDNSQEMAVEEAFSKIYDEKTKKFRDPNSPKIQLTFKEALDAKLIDPDVMIMDSSGELITTREAVERGIIDPKTGTLKDKKSGGSISVKDAAKMGLLAIVGAPILAGKVVVDAVKGLRKSKSPERKRSIEAPATQITIKTTKAPSPQKELASKSIPLKDALHSGKIQPDQCFVTVNVAGEPKRISVKDAFDRSLINLNSPIVIQGNTEISVVDEKSKFKVTVSKHLNPKELAEIGAYDVKSESFVDPQTGEIVNFEDLVGGGSSIFDPKMVTVKNLQSGEQVPLQSALSMQIIDPQTGSIIDPATGKVVPFFEALKLGWIVQTDISKSTKKPEPGVSLTHALQSGAFNPVTGEMTDPKTNEVLSLASALTANIIDPDLITIRNPVNDDLLSLTEAIECGIVDLSQGVIINPETKEETSFKEAFEKGYVLSGFKKPISLEPIVKRGWYTSNGQILDPLTKKEIDIGEAVKRGIVDQFITECKDTKANNFITLNDALKSALVDPKIGKLKNSLTGTLIPLDTAVEQGLIRTNNISFPLIQAIVQDYYSPKNGKFLNPCIGEEQTLKEAKNSKFVDCTSVLVKDTQNDKMLTVDEAEHSGLLDCNKGVLKYPIQMTLDTAYQKGYLLTTQKPLSLQESLAQGCYDPKTGLMVLGEERITLDDAMNVGEINRNALTVKDSRSGDIITLADAVKIGVVDPKAGTVTDPTNGAEMHFYDALERGLIVPAKRKFSLPEAVFKGFYDPASGRFTSPETQEKLQTDRAIRRGIIDPASTMVKVDGKVLTFEHAVEDGIIDAKAGTIRFENQKLDFQEAFEQGLLIEVRRPMSLNEAVLKGIYDERTGLFVDPATGEQLTLLQAIQSYLIDPDSVHVKDTRSGFLKKLNLAEAIKHGFIDGTTGKVKDFSKGGSEVSIVDAFKSDLLVDSKAAVSIQRAIHQGLYDDETGKFTDPNTGRKITLHESIRRFIINPLLPCYWDKKTERLLSLVETCRAGIIDRRAGMFREPGANCTISLSGAMELGLIVDIESAGFGLYEAVAMGLCEEGKFVHPSTGRKLTLSDAVKEELINPVTSIVKNTKTGKYLKLPEAVEATIIDDIVGVYQVPDTTKIISLQEAKNKGLIVTAKKPLSIEEAVRCGLFRTDSGKFADPESGEFHDLLQAIGKELINADTTALKDPVTGHLKSVNSGIEDGTIDISKGRVIDPKTKRSYSIDAALHKGILVTVEKPITFQQAVRRGSIDFLKGTFKDPRTMRECTLEEAIKYELIDPESAVVKDPKCGSFLTLKKAISDGIIDLNKRAALDPQTGKVKSLCIMFEQGTIVFLREPLSFDVAIEQGHLDMFTGKFTDPQSKEVLTLKEAITLGLIDPDSVLVKDTAKKKLLKLPEAFRKGIMDSDKGNVLDTVTSKLHTLPKAIAAGLVTTHGLSLIEGLDYSLYNPTTGAFTDPFCSSGGVMERRRLNLAEAIKSGLIDPSTSVVKDSTSGEIASVQDAIVNEVIDPVAGRMLESSSGKTIDLLKAKERGYIIPAEARVSDLLTLTLFPSLVGFAPFRFSCMTDLKRNCICMNFINYINNFFQNNLHLQKLIL